MLIKVKVYTPEEMPRNYTQCLTCSKYRVHMYQMGKAFLLPVTEDGEALVWESGWAEAGERLPWCYGGVS